MKQHLSRWWRVIPERGEKRKWVLQLPQLSDLRLFPSCDREGGSKWNLADSLSWTHEAKSPQRWRWPKVRRLERRGCTEKELWRSSEFTHWVFSWVLINTSVSENCPRPGKGHLKELKVIVLIQCLCPRVRVHYSMLPRALSKVH